jgi:hypothetical protein
MLMTTPYAIEVKTYQGGTSYVPKSKPKKRVTEAEYWEKYYNYPDKVYEWHNGELEEKSVSEHVTYLTHDWFSELFNHYLRVHPVAKPAGLEMGFRLILPNEVSIRRPDLGIVLNDNPVPLLPNDCSYNGIFDMCIEAISESSASELTRDTITKKAEYAENGVKEYFILDGHRRHTYFYYLGANGMYLPHKPLKGNIIKSKVLPGFQFRIADLYQKPSPDEMINDPVYQEFVLPGYSEAKQKLKEEKQAREKAEKQIQKEQQAKEEEKQAREKAEKQVQKELWAKEKAENRAEKAENRAEKAEQQAKQLAAKLRELGINPEDIQ